MARAPLPPISVCTIASRSLSLIRDLDETKKKREEDHSMDICAVRGLSRVSFVGRRNDKFSSQLPRARHRDPPTCTTEIILSGPDLSPNEQHYRDSGEDIWNIRVLKTNDTFFVSDLDGCAAVAILKPLVRGHLGISQLIAGVPRIIYII